MSSFAERMLPKTLALISIAATIASSTPCASLGTGCNNFYGSDSYCYCPSNQICNEAAGTCSGGQCTGQCFDVSGISSSITTAIVISVLVFCCCPLVICFFFGYGCFAAG